MVGCGVRLACIFLQTPSLTSWLKQGSWDPPMRGLFLPLRSYLATEVFEGFVERSLKGAEIVQFSRKFESKVSS